MDTNTENSNIPVILIVDDNERNLQLLANILMDTGYEVAVAMNGHDAIEFTKDITPDLILLDILMPGIDGLETCKLLKEDPANRDIPVIFITAKSDTADIIKGFETGAVDYVTKPFNSFELLSRVKTHMELKLSREKVKSISTQRKELLHILSHDLLNPFSQLNSAIKLISNGDLSFDDLKDELSISVNTGIELINLVRKMHSLEDKNIDLSCVNLLDCVCLSEKIMEHKLKSKDITIKKNINGSINVVAERISLTHSVIINLLTNAIKFSHPGTDIEVMASTIDNKVEILVKDYGIGMPKKLVMNLFDITKTTSRPGTDGEMGTGFGLPLVKKFVDIFNGSIEVSSLETDANQKHGGTTIRLLLNECKGD